MSKWISVRNKRPPKEGRYLTIFEHKVNESRWVDIGYYTPEYEWDGPVGPGWSEVNVTHWMNLPELTKSEDMDDG